MCFVWWNEVNEQQVRCSEIPLTHRTKFWQGVQFNEAQVSNGKRTVPSTLEFNSRMKIPLEVCVMKSRSLKN